METFSIFIGNEMPLYIESKASNIQTQIKKLRRNKIINSKIENRENKKDQYKIAQWLSGKS